MEKILKWEKPSQNRGFWVPVERDGGVYFGRGKGFAGVGTEI